MRFFTSALLFLSAAVAPSAAQLSTPPAAPGLTFLYTSFVSIGAPIPIGLGPKGVRLAIPITGGNFTGPLLKGTILNLGADWGLTDPKTGLFSPDTRYNFVTNDGANIFLQTSGTIQPDGTIHLRAVYETGYPKYYWLNNIVAVGILRQVGAQLLRIDVWNLAGELTTTPTLKLNGTCV